MLPRSQREPPRRPSAVVPLLDSHQQMMSARPGLAPPRKQRTHPAIPYDVVQGPYEVGKDGIHVIETSEDSYDV